MKTTAVRLLEDYTRLISAGKPDEMFALFAADAVFEFPYFPSVGIPGRLVGIDAIRKQIAPVFDNVENFKFHDVQIFAAADPNVAFGEYSVVGRVKTTGRTYRQTYGGRLEAADGKIKRLREFSNPVTAAQAFFPNGLKDVSPIA